MNKASELVVAKAIDGNSNGNTGRPIMRKPKSKYARMRTNEISVDMIRFRSSLVDFRKTKLNFPKMILLMIFGSLSLKLSMYVVISFLAFFLLYLRLVYPLLVVILFTGTG
jgi:hypothetical protein